MSQFALRSALWGDLVEHTPVERGSQFLQVIFVDPLAQFFLQVGASPEAEREEIGVGGIPLVLALDLLDVRVVRIDVLGEHATAASVVEVFRIDVIGAEKIEQGGLGWNEFLDVLAGQYTGLVPLIVQQAQRVSVIEADEDRRRAK